MMKLDGIATFVAVAEAGSISEAARRLEPVKVRGQRPAGRTRAQPWCAARAPEHAQAEPDGGWHRPSASGPPASPMRSRRRWPKWPSAAATLVGPLRISAPVTFGRMHLGPAVYPFLAKHPGIELTLDLDDRRVDVSAEGYDAVVRHGPLLDSRLVAWRLAPSRRVLVASPDYLARHGTPGTAGRPRGPSRDLLHEPGRR